MVQSASGELAKGTGCSVGAVGEGDVPSGGAAGGAEIDVTQRRRGAWRKKRAIGEDDQRGAISRQTQSDTGGAIAIIGGGQGADLAGKRIPEFRVAGLAESGGERLAADGAVGDEVDFTAIGVSVDSADRHRNSGARGDKVRFEYRRKGGGERSYRLHCSPP